MKRKVRCAVAVACVPVFLVAALLLTAYLWVSYKFMNATLDIIIIQLSLPLKGLDAGYFYNAGMAVLCVLFACILYALALRRTCCGGKGGVRSVLLPLLPFLLLGLSLWLVERKYEVWEFLFPGERFSTYIEENYFLPDVSDFTFPDGRNNLVIIELESVERTFNDESIFKPILMPKMDRLQREGTEFYRQRQAPGSEYSASGFTSLVFGMPSKPSATIRDKVDIFLGRLDPEELVVPDSSRNFRNSSLMGILEQHGYRISLFRAADKNYGGYGVTMSMSTNECDIRDASYFIDGGHTAKQNSWGLFDGYLYEQAKKYMQERSGKGPFAMIIQTVDTHPPGYFEPDMETRYGDFRDAFVQADRLVADFVEWIRNQPFGDETTILVVGDHLLGENVMRLPPTGERSIMAFAINAKAVPEVATDKRLFATWDLTATVFEAIGARFPGRRFGLGTSLFSSEKTLFEKNGVDDYLKNIKKRSRFSESRYGW